MKRKSISNLGLAAIITLCSVQSSNAADVNNPNGTTLTGPITVTGNLSNSGVLNIGSSISTVTGNYTQSSTGVVLVDINSSGAGLLKIDGTANITPVNSAGNLEVQINGGGYTGNRSFVVITASGGGLSTGFTPLVSAPPVSTDGDNYTVLARRDNNSVTLFMVEDGEVDNKQTFSSYSSVATDLAYMNNNNIFQHLGANRGSVGGQNTAMLNQPFEVASAGSDLSNLLETASGSAQNYGSWIKTFGSFSDIGGKNGLSGYDAKTGGFIGGFENELADNFLGGVSIGYSQTRVNGSGSADINTPRISLYGSYDLGGANLDAVIGYANSRISASRDSILGSETSEHNQDEYSAAAQYSKSYLQEDGYKFTPKLGLQYAHIDSEGYRENGSFARATVDANSLDSLQPFIGTDISREFNSDSGIKYTPQINLSYHHELLNTNRNMNVVTNGIQSVATGIEAARSTISLGAGVEAELDDELNAYAGYNADLYLDRGNNQTVSAGLKYEF